MKPTQEEIESARSSLRALAVVRYGEDLTDRLIGGTPMALLRVMAEDAIHDGDWREDEVALVRHGLRVFRKAGQ